MKQYADLDFSKAAKILNVLVDPVASDDTGLGTGQMWFNTTSKFFKGYDGTTKFQLLRDDLAATITGVFTFNPSTGSVPFTVHSSKTGVVTYLNADEVDGYDAAEAATASTLAARDASGNLTVATPTSDGHAATKAYVDSIAAGQDWKDSCIVATTANITLSGAQTIDGVAVVADDRVLVKDQTTASENGIYVCAAGAWSRAADADENAEVTSGLTTYIEQGNDNAGAGYTLTTSGTIVVGTTSLTFTKTSGGSVYSQGNGIVKSGTTFHFAQAASYAVGNIPYASGASTIGFVSAGAAGTVLKGQGASAPIYAAVDLTADVTGTLPVGNGGTGTATQFTQGSVIFSGASGVYTEDNSGLFFDAANNRLGINTATPGSTLTVNGTSYFHSSLSSWNTIGDTPLNFARESIYGYSSAYKVLQIGLVGANSAISIGADVSANVSSSFGGNEIVFPHAVNVISPNAANSSYLGLFGVDGSNVLHIGSPGYNVTAGGALRVDLANSRVGYGTSAPVTGFEIADALMAGNQTNGTNGQVIIRGRESASVWRVTMGCMYSSGDAYFGNGVKPHTSSSTFVGGYTATAGGGAVVIGSDATLKFYSMPSQAITLDGAITTLNTYTIWHSGNDGAGSTLDADTVDGYEASALLDLANSTGDTDDISEGLTNLFYTDARARAAISSTDSAEIAYNNSTGVLGLGTEAGRVKAGTLGAGASPTFTHNLGTRNVLCQVFRNSSPYDEVKPEIKRTDTNTVTVEFTGITPSSGDFIIVCSAANG